MGKSRIWNILGLVFLVAVVWLLIKNFKDIEAIVVQANNWGLLIIILSYGLFAATPLTTDPLTVMAGAIYGPMYGLLISLIGNTIAALVEYYFGIKIGMATKFKDAKGKLPFGLGRLPTAHPLFLIFGRMVPGYGSKILSIVAGMYHVPIRRYLWTTFITNVLGGLLLSFGGYHIIRLLK